AWERSSFRDFLLIACRQLQPYRLLPVEHRGKLRPLPGEARRAAGIALVDERIGERGFDRFDALARALDQSFGRLYLLGKRLERRPPARRFPAAVRLRGLVGLALLAPRRRAARHLVAIVVQVA